MTPPETILTNSSHADEAAVADYSSYIEWKDWKPFELDGKQARALSREFRDIRIAADTRVLELGFGAGAFALWVRERGASYVGVEVNQNLVDAARQAGFEAETDVSFSWREKSFDVIVALDVLEHIPKAELPIYMKRFAAVSHPGAIWLFRFPNGLSPLGLMYQNSDITHLASLSGDILRQAAAGLPVELISIRDERFPGVRDKIRFLEPIAWLQFCFRRGVLWAIKKVLGLPNVNLDSNTIVVMKYKG